MQQILLLLGFLKPHKKRNREKYFTWAFTF